MARIQTRQQRIAEWRECMAKVDRALHEATPSETKVVIGLHVVEAGEQKSRVPIIGLEPGAIRGTIPHRARVERWAR